MLSLKMFQIGMIAKIPAVAAIAAAAIMYKNIVFKGTLSTKKNFWYVSDMNILTKNIKVKIDKWTFGTL